MMFKQKFMNGIPVDDAYAKQIAALVSQACLATELVSEDELEAFAERQRREPLRSGAFKGASVSVVLLKLIQAKG